MLISKTHVLFKIQPPLPTQISWWLLQLSWPPVSSSWEIATRDTPSHQHKDLRWGQNDMVANPLSLLHSNHVASWGTTSLPRKCETTNCWILLTCSSKLSMLLLIIFGFSLRGITWEVHFQIFQVVSGIYTSSNKSESWVFHLLHQRKKKITIDTPHFKDTNSIPNSRVTMFFKVFYPLPKLFSTPTDLPASNWPSWRLTQTRTHD